MANGATPNWIGVDLNATRGRAAAGPDGGSPRPLRLDEQHQELPLAVRLDGRAPELGRAALRLCRRSPHLVCAGFLPFVGRERTWAAGRLRLDATQALQLVLERLRPLAQHFAGFALALPAYWQAEQTNVLAALVKKLRLPVLGSAAAPLAAALAAHGQQPWPHAGVVVDVDDHALTASAVELAGGRLEVRQTRSYPELGLRLWKERLLDRVADRCVRQSRRDPRELPEVEQSLFEQLEAALGRGEAAGSVELVIQTPNWYQNLALRADDLAAFCAPLAQRAAEAVRGLAGGAGPLVLTAEAGQLPGLAAALRDGAPARPHPAAADDEDFGEGLLSGDFGPGPAALRVLPAEAVACGAWELAARFARREMPAGHLTGVALAAQPAPDAGPARLEFQGQTYPLTAKALWIGRHLGCDLVIDGDRYPAVSARHCEIVFDLRHYVLRDRGRHGTLINDRPVAQQAVLQPGDLICLGPRGGPVLRFLGGVSAEGRRFVTTA
jgi:hypothetical protein